MILKSEDKEEEEKRLIAELWAKTENDGKEHGILIGGDIRMYMDGDEMEISAGEWAKVLTGIYKNPEISFDFIHTHAEWDSPLSRTDIYTFLYVANLRSMTAITGEHKYTITRTKETPVIALDRYDEIETKYVEYANTHTKHDDSNEENYCYGEMFREGLCASTRELAREYKFLYREEEL